MKGKSIRISLVVLAVLLIVASLYFTLNKNKLLSVGSEGKSVKRLQEALIEKGASISADGKFGSKTEKALIDIYGKATIYESQIRKV